MASGLVISILFLVACFQALAIAATPTHVVVHVRSRGAMFVGDGVGGAFVQIKDSLGTVLAEGITQGSSGNQTQIMLTPSFPGDALTDANTAKFETTLLLESPKLITLVARAPRNYPSSQTEGSLTIWLFPGQHLDAADALTIELPGFILALEPIGDWPLKATQEGIKAYLRHSMLCGCAVGAAGSLWDYTKWTLLGLVSDESGSTVLPPVTLVYESPSRFYLPIVLAQRGTYTVQVFASDSRTGNTATDRASFIVY